MELQTNLKLDKPIFQINYTTPMMLIGSCFVENIGIKLENYRFKVDINPCGIVYNPISAANTLDILLKNREFTEKDLLVNNGKWVSLSHHGDFSAPEKEVCLQNINQRKQVAIEHLKNTAVLIITWGTAWVYRHRKSGQIVANCHKFPASDFQRYRLEIDEIVNVYIDLINRLQNFCPGIKILFTISPVRHWKDGAHGNQLSKAVLMLAMDKLMSLYDQISYFPSYEIVMDELRDYRFYADDMLHISSRGIEYIWEKFTDLYMSADTKNLMKRIDKINKILQHRPFDPDSEETKRLRIQAQEELEEIMKTLTK